MTDVSAVWLVVGPLVGYAAAFGSEVYRDRTGRVARREERLANRQETREDRRDEFERTNLLALQDALQVAMRLAGREHHLNEMEWATKQTWGREQLPEEVGGEPSVLAHHELARRHSRIFDEALRKRVSQLRDDIAAASVPTLQGEQASAARTRCHARFEAASHDYAPLMEAIGERIRALYVV